MTLQWAAPPECPTGDQVLEDAGTLANNRSALARSGEPISVRATVERLAADRWSLLLTIGEAERRLEASSCAQLSRAAALFLALVMDPSLGELSQSGPKDAVQPGQSEAPDQETPAAREATPPPLSPPAITAPASPERGAVAAGSVKASILLAAGLMVDVGTLPRAELLGALEVGFRYRRVDVTALGGGGPSQDKTVDGTAGARLRPLTLMLTPCYAALVTGPLRLGPCARGEVGWLHAEGIGVPQTQVKDAIWVAAGAAATAWLAVSANVEVRLDIGALAPLVRPRFQLTGVGSVFEPGIAMRSGAAAVLRF